MKYYSRLKSFSTLSLTYNMVLKRQFLLKTFFFYFFFLLEWSHLLRTSLSREPCWTLSLDVPSYMTLNVLIPLCRPNCNCDQYQANPLFRCMFFLTRVSRYQLAFSLDPCICISGKIITSKSIYIIIKIQDAYLSIQFVLLS